MKGTICGSYHIAGNLRARKLLWIGFRRENFSGMLKSIMGEYGTPKKFVEKLSWVALKPANMANIECLMLLFDWKCYKLAKCMQMRQRVASSLGPCTFSILYAWGRG